MTEDYRKFQAFFKCSGWRACAIVSPRRTSVSTPCGLVEDVVRRTPRAGLAEDDDGGAAELEDRFLRAPLVRPVQRMHLHDTSDGQGADLDEAEAPEIVRGQEVRLPLVAKQNVRLVLPRVPVHRPQRWPRPPPSASRARAGSRPSFASRRAPQRRRMTRSRLRRNH